MIANTAGIIRGQKKYIPMSPDEKEDLRLSCELAEYANRPGPKIKFDFRAIRRLKWMGKTYILRKEPYGFNTARARQLKNTPVHIKKVGDVSLSSRQDPPAILHDYAAAAGYVDGFEWEKATTYHDPSRHAYRFRTYFLYEVRTHATPAPGQMTLSGGWA